MEENKKIQEAFKLKLGLIVDKPKPGYGSSNDGNTARRFFQNAYGVDKDLIERLGTILATIQVAIL